MSDNDFIAIEEPVARFDSLKSEKPKKFVLESPWEHTKEIKVSADAIASVVASGNEDVPHDSKIMNIRLDNSGKFVTIVLWNPQFKTSSSREIEK